MKHKGKGNVLYMDDYRKKDQQQERRKKIGWVGNARKDLKAIPKDVRENIGHQLWLLQSGQMPADFKSMPTIGQGVYEIRVPDANGRNVGRCFYVANIGNEIMVLHSFVKTKKKTPKADIQKGQERFKVLQDSIKKKSI